jgi:phage head maturation protease
MFEAPNTTDGNDLLELLKRGDISQSSFAFTLAADKDSEKWVRNADGQIERHIYKIGGLYDVSPVFTPAYSSTSCLTRNLSEKLEEIKENDTKLDLILEEIKLM